MSVKVPFCKLHFILLSFILLLICITVDRTIEYCPRSICYVRFEVFTAVTMKNGVFWEEAHGVTSQKTPFFKHMLLFQLQFVLSISE
jgi:hypothetical protein